MNISIPRLVNSGRGDWTWELAGDRQLSLNSLAWTFTTRIPGVIIIYAVEHLWRVLPCFIAVAVTVNEDTSL